MCRSKSRGGLAGLGEGRRKLEEKKEEMLERGIERGSGDRDVLKEPASMRMGKATIQ